jgi:5-methylcytosine-specific restriction endonuclease McrA
MDSARKQRVRTQKMRQQDGVVAAVRKSMFKGATRERYEFQERHPGDVLKEYVDSQVRETDSATVAAARTAFARCGPTPHTLRAAIDGGVSHFTCSLCQMRLPADLATVDHIQARSEGGSHDITNLRLACEPCNNGRHNNVGRLQPTGGCDLRGNCG